MFEILVPGRRYFSDFAFDTVECSIKRYLEIFATLKGLGNEDENGRHIGFMVDADMQEGDVLILSDSEFIVKKVGYDTYQGNPALVKAYY